MEVQTPKRNWGKSTKFFQTTAFPQLNPFFLHPNSLPLPFKARGQADEHLP